MRGERRQFARDAQQWPRAARFYRKALDRNPKKPPIWVQYGHALKESGDPAAAARAYRAALSYAAGVADTHLQLGHALKLQGKTEEAQAAYLRAFALDPTLPHPGAELSGLGWSESQLRELRSWRADDPGFSVPQDFEFAATQRDPISRSYPDEQEYNTRSDDIEWVIETIRTSRLFDEETEIVIWRPTSTLSHISSNGAQPRVGVPILVSIPYTIFENTQISRVQE